MVFLFFYYSDKVRYYCLVFDKKFCKKTCKFFELIFDEFLIYKKSIKSFFEKICKSKVGS